MDLAANRLRCRRVCSSYVEIPSRPRRPGHNPTILSDRLWEFGPKSDASSRRTATRDPTPAPSQVRGRTVDRIRFGFPPIRRRRRSSHKKSTVFQACLADACYDITPPRPRPSAALLSVEQAPAAMTIIVARWNAEAERRCYDCDNRVREVARNGHWPPTESRERRSSRWSLERKTSHRPGFTARDRDLCQIAELAPARDQFVILHPPPGTASRARSLARGGTSFAKAAARMWFKLEKAGIGRRGGGAIVPVHN